MDNVTNAIKTIIKRMIQNEIDYSKTYQFSCLAFNHTNQTITGQCVSGKLGVISNIPIYATSPLKYTIISPKSLFLVQFLESDPGKPICTGISLSSVTSAMADIANTPSGNLTISSI